jgi:acyl carrier protein
MTLDEVRNAAAARLKMCQELREMTVNRLDLAIDPDWITNDQPLFGRGLELDSIDTLELILGVESDFDVSLTEDDRWVFGSIAKLAEHITQNMGDGGAGAR